MDVMKHEGRKALDLLLARQSVGQMMLQAPAPEGEELDLILDAGLRAPDHGRLRPWRFVTIQGEAKAAFGERLVEAARERDPANAEALAERFRGWTSRVPLFIAVGVDVRPDNKIPEVEQLLSAGAAAMNMLNAVHLLGYAGMWVTGPNTYDPKVNELLGFKAPSHLVGYLTIGTPKGTLPVSRPERAAYAVDWTG
jgi:nitroreductase